MDGTLVDTEGLWWQAAASVAASLGRPLSPADAPHVHGRTVEDVAAYLGAPGTARPLTAAFADLIGRDLTIMPGALELLSGLAATTIPTALVSASPQSIVDLVLPRLGHTFDLVIANEDTARGKPWPDPYLEAARRLGATPARCVAVEDSPTGIAAARAAGCRVLVVSEGLPSLLQICAYEGDCGENPREES
ncbi:haloacid dehalogenase superfamily, subfamily IA, variant 3 with third motif having DD or ED [Nonomuraea solani]|uniref:Haloacid dehalogenase superfamily, subfamily IA, variant 3 with third motif having DD or ED n=2 Tax=Nonomuraea solani TaxID=1144553 RepID=A0A1H6DSJ4_9ACTN|nr:haloacid dehalogenase superfamily, subfamily IA, variant 3 with third motif having DD or ED [Nonomuraea solani]